MLSLFWKLNFDEFGICWKERLGDENGGRLWWSEGVDQSNISLSLRMILISFLFTILLSLNCPCLRFSYLSNFPLTLGHRERRKEINKSKAHLSRGPIFGSISDRKLVGKLGR